MIKNNFEAGKLVQALHDPRWVLLVTKSTAIKFNGFVINYADKVYKYKFVTDISNHLYKTYDTKRHDSKME